MATLWFRDSHPLGASPAWREILDALGSRLPLLRRFRSVALLVYAIVVLLWTPHAVPQLLHALLAFDSSQLDVSDPAQGLGRSATFLLLLLGSQRVFTLGLTGNDVSFCIPVRLRAVVPRLFFLVPVVLLLVLGFVLTVAEMLGAERIWDLFTGGWALAATLACLVLLGWGGYRASLRINLYELVARYLFLLGVLCLILLTFGLPIDYIQEQRLGDAHQDTATYRSLFLASHVPFWLLTPALVVLAVRTERRLVGRSVYLDATGESDAQ